MTALHPASDAIALLDFEWQAGPQACDRCEHHDGGHHRGYCDDCAPHGVLIGMRCAGLRGQACVAMGVRLEDGCWQAPSGQKACRACAAVACCGEGEDCERVECVLEAMEG